jgi:uncharacterized protein YndB with AHSA1/START domain
MPATAVKNEAPRTVTQEHELAAPPEKVWRALTQSDLLAQWLMPNDFAAKVGHKFQMRYQIPGRPDGIVNCEVLELTAPKRMRLAWDGGGSVGATVVSLTLTPTPGGTRINLEQGPFPPSGSEWEYKGAHMGWNDFLGTKLPKVLAELK